MCKLLSIGIAAGLLAVTLHATAGDPEYPVSAIAAAMKENAHVVKRLEEVSVKINDAQDVRYTHRYVKTILDEVGADDAEMIEQYDKLREIRSISGTLYDAEGKVIKRLKQSDIRDVSAVDGSSLMTDARVKIHRFYNVVYPYTIEYTIEMKFNNTLMSTSWQPQDDVDCTVEQSKLTVEAPAAFELRYQEYLYNGQPVVTEAKGAKVYTWEVKQLAALKDEPYPIEFYRRTPSVFVGAVNFELEDYKGSRRSWKDFGSFVYKLNEGRTTLPDNIKTKVHELTDNLKTRNEKISALYKFLQQNTRYISVQLGIGGWQAYDATYVATKGYGDCKALSNYMKSLLQEAGISSNLVLINGSPNRRTIREDFPSLQFNHMILCVPDVKDTTWLECTSHIDPAGYLGSYTGGRPALVIDEKESKLAFTPVYGMDANLQTRSITATVDSTGNVSAAVVTRFTGEQQDELNMKTHALSREKLLELLRKELDLSSYDISDYQFRELGTPIPSMEEKIGINAHNYATVTGKRMFFLPNLLSRNGQKLEEDTLRRSPVRFNYAYRDIDTVHFILPAGYKPESLPAPVAISGKFGTYTASILVNGNTLSYIRKMERKAGSFPPTDYPELVKFYTTIYKSDRSRIVLVKN